jgi:hypothetical protein
VYTVPGVETAECPVSLITGRSRELIQIVIRARQLQRSGGSLFAAGEWPVEIVDAVCAVEQADCQVENARIEAESN